VDPLVIGGVRLADGTLIEADFVLDCGGRRTLVPGWLAAAGAEIPYDSQDCDVTYFTRYYRLRPESPMSPVFVVAVGSEVVNAVGLITFPGDHNTFAVGLSASPTDEALSVLRHSWAFDAVTHLMPGVTPWIDKSNATPINDVAVMSGQRNIRRHFVVDGRPAALGLLPVGDSLCTTNPTYGWGASMALTYAFAAVGAIVDNGDDPEATALAYDAAVSPEADAVYRESAAMDRLRIYRWRRTEIPEHDVAEMRRQDLIARGVQRGSTRDPVLGRAFLRRSNLLERPNAVLDDPEVVERAEAMYAKSVKKDAEATALTREDVLAAITAAAPPGKEPAPV
jgi:2-polyprenyl-6-methoxyphenol hydroxylase-like FAD-dependent oxidoreductase